MSEREPYWCKSTPNVPAVWSASSLLTLGECPRKFELRYVEGWSGKEESLDFVFGTAFHAAMHKYWAAQIRGQSKAEALDNAIQVAWAFDLPKPARPSQLGKTHIGLARLLTAYHDDYNDKPDMVMLVGGEPALEVEFSFLLPVVSADGTPYRMRGYIDALVNFGGCYTCLDYKTTGRPLTDWYFQKFEINVQNYIYSAAAQVLTGVDFTRFLVDAVSINQYGDVELQRKPIDLTTGEIEEGLVDVSEFIRLAEHYASRNYWPKNTAACTMCEFNNVCNKDPKTRINVLESDFIQQRREFADQRS